MSTKFLVIAFNPPSLSSNRVFVPLQVATSNNCEAGLLGKDSYMQPGRIIKLAGSFRESDKLQHSRNTGYYSRHRSSRHARSKFKKNLWLTVGIIAGSAVVSFALVHIADKVRSVAREVEYSGGVAEVVKKKVEEKILADLKSGKINKDDVQKLKEKFGSVYSAGEIRKLKDKYRGQFSAEEVRLLKEKLGK